MSSIVKKVGGAIKSVGKAIGGAVKNIASGVGKVFQKVWHSTLGKVLITAAAIYLGGAVLGAWAGPGWLGFTAAGPTVTANAATGATTIDSFGAAGNALAAGGSVATAPGGAVASGLPSTAGAGAAAAQPGIVGSQIPGQLGPLNYAGAAPAAQAAPVAAAPAVAPSTVATVGGGASGDNPFSASAIFKTIQGLGGWVEKNPLISAVGLNATASYFTPSPAEQDAEAEKARVRRLNANTAVGGVQQPSPSGNPLTTTSGAPVYNPVTGVPNAASLVPNPRVSVPNPSAGLIGGRM